jgi:hypothetical protein
MTVETIRVIHHFCQYQQEIPQEVYSRICSVSNDNASLNSDWSDGSAWIRVLEMGVSRTRKTTILNLLEYMGAWEWYDRQVKLSQGTIRTKKKSIEGVGRLALEEGGRVSDPLPKDCDSPSRLK